MKIAGPFLLGTCIDNPKDSPSSLAIFIDTITRVEQLYGPPTTEAFKKTTREPYVRIWRGGKSNVEIWGTVDEFGDLVSGATGGCGGCK